MKNKIIIFLTALFSLATSLTAVAADINADNNAALTITTDTFTYTNNNSYNFQNGFLLESELADPDFMVVGMTYYTSEPEKVFGYVVAPINSDRLGSGGIGVFYHGTIEEELGNVELQVGDLLKVDGMVECTDIYPTTYVPVEDATMYCLGNGVDIFGEEFKRVIRLQMVIEQADFEVRSENGAIYNIDLVKGDVTVDDSVNILDGIALNKAVLAGAELCDYAKLVGDVNENGALDADDSLMILKETIGLTENFE